MRDIQVLAVWTDIQAADPELGVHRLLQLTTRRLSRVDEEEWSEEQVVGALARLAQRAYDTTDTPIGDEV